MLSVHALIWRQGRFLSCNQRMLQLGGKDSYFISIWSLWHCSQMCGCVGEHCSIRNAFEREMRLRLFYEQVCYLLSECFWVSNTSSEANPSSMCSICIWTFHYLIVIRQTGLPYTRLLYQEILVPLELSVFSFLLSLLTLPLQTWQDGWKPQQSGCRQCNYSKQTCLFQQV